MIHLTTLTAGVLDLHFGLAQGPGTSFGVAEHRPCARRTRNPMPEELPHVGRQDPVPEVLRCGQDDAQVVIPAVNLRDHGLRHGHVFCSLI
jgi:hypothetical protein